MNNAQHPARVDTPVFRHIRFTVAAFDMVKQIQRLQHTQHGVIVSNSDVLNGILTGAFPVDTK